MSNRPSLKVVQCMLGLVLNKCNSELGVQSSTILSLAESLKRQAGYNSLKSLLKAEYNAIKLISHNSNIHSLKSVQYR